MHYSCSVSHVRPNAGSSRVHGESVAHFGGQLKMEQRQTQRYRFFIGNTPYDHSPELLTPIDRLG